MIGYTTNISELCRSPPSNIFYYFLIFIYAYKRQEKADKVRKVRNYKRLLYMCFLNISARQKVVSGTRIKKLKNWFGCTRGFGIFSNCIVSLISDLRWIFSNRNYEGKFHSEEICCDPCASRQKRGSGAPTSDVPRSFCTSVQNMKVWGFQNEAF